MFDNIDASQLEALVAPRIIAAIEQSMGLTAAQALAYLKESDTEHPENDAAWHIQDSAGKFRHGWRIGEIGHREWGSAVDAFWPFVEPTVTAVVQAVADAAPTT